MYLKLLFSSGHMYIYIIFSALCPSHSLIYLSLYISMYQWGEERRYNIADYCSMYHEMMNCIEPTYVNKPRNFRSRG